MIVFFGKWRDAADRLQTPLILIAAILITALVVKLTGSRTIETTVVEMMIRIVVVVGIYIFIGNSGVISFGHIGFMCIGAYAAAWASADPIFKQVLLTGLPTFLRDQQYSFATAMVLATLLPTVVAILLGGAIMRLDGVACSIATFSFLMIVNSIYSNWDSVTAGVSSITSIPSVVGIVLATGFAIAAVVVAYAFQTSRLGMMLKATRDEPAAASASGIRIIKVRLVSFALSAAVVGAGGGLYAHFLGVLTVDPFYLQLCFLTIAMLVVGGMSSLSGAVVGVFVVTIVVEVLRGLERGDGVVAIPVGSQELGLGLIMAVVLVFRPLGATNGREFRLFKPQRSRPEATVAGAASPGKIK